MLSSLIESARTAQQAGDWEEALEHFEAALRRVPLEGTARDAAEVLRWIATIYREQGELELASEITEASLAVAEVNGMAEDVAHALNCLAGIELLRGRLDEAEPLFVRSRELAEGAGNDQIAALVDQNLGILANIRGSSEVALERYDSALSRFRRLGDSIAAAHALTNMGKTHLQLSHWEPADNCFAEAVRIGYFLSDVKLVGVTELNRADLYLQRQWFEQARESCDRAFDIFSRAKSRSRVGEAYKYYGMIYRETGKLDLADVQFALALGLAEACGEPLLEAETRAEWAVAHLEAARYVEALTCLNEAHRIFSELRARRELLDVTQRLERLRRTYLPAVERWGASGAEARDRFRTGHMGRVAKHSRNLATAAGLTGWDLTWVEVGALVHDVGKQAVPAELIEKVGPPTAVERKFIESHTVVGDSMVEGLRFPAHVRPMVRSHHERWDGGGYPDRMGGQEIPLEVRILAVANLYDVLTTPRRDRPAHEPAAALQIMKQEAGRILDPELVGLFTDRLAVAA